MDEIIIDASVPTQFGDLLGGLMGAVIEAQTQAARATAEFITDVGTTNKSLGSDIDRELNTLSFNYSKLDENGQEASYTLKIPLLSLVEIPAISIKTAKFSFYYDVKATIDSTSKETTSPISKKVDFTESKDDAKLNLFNRPTKLYGRVNKQTNTTSNIEKNAGIRVDVEFEKSSMTVGLERVIDMLELASKEGKITKPQKEIPK